MYSVLRFARSRSPKPPGFNPISYQAIGLLFSLLWLAQLSSAQSTEQPLDWVYLENKELRVGLLRSHGGAIGFLSAQDSQRNLLNHYDHGRLIQQSYYGDEDGSKWAEKPWRYNPVQAGDYQGHPAELLEFRSTATTAYARTRPRYWAGGELLEDCELEQSIELDGPLVKLKYSFHYRGKQTHAARDQETPAVFVAPELTRLATYSGKRPWADEELSVHTPGWPNEYLDISEHWVAWVDDQNRGLGIFVPAANRATCYRYQGGNNSDCSYVAPLNQFALKPDLSFSYEAWITTGELKTIRARFQELHRQSLKAEASKHP
jgi:hypothetical protein